jgi:hypothetical protein
MSRATGVLLVLTCVLLVAWLTTGAGRGLPRGPRASQVSAPSGPPDPLVTGIRQQADRLRTHLAVARPLQPISRDPFRFEVRDRPAPALRRGAALTTAPVDRPARPDMRLSGIASDVVGHTTVRTAVISATNQVFLVREGERVLGRYLVVRIGADAVTLQDGAVGETFTLALR